MAVVRIEKTKDFTIMSNYHLKDRELSLKSKGLLSLMLSLPEDWDYTIEGLSHICVEGKGAIRTAIEELETKGYISRQRTHGADGQFAGNEYIVREEPAPSSKNPTMDHPTMENPSLENCTQLNTNLPSTKELIPPKAPQGGRQRREPKKAPDWEPERFAAFWAYYPRGESKQAAIAAWDKLRPSSELIATMGRALKRQMQTEEWQRGVGIPYASTWLNQRRWEDERRAPKPPAEEGSLPLWT